MVADELLFKELFFALTDFEGFFSGLLDVECWPGSKFASMLAGFLRTFVLVCGFNGLFDLEFTVLSIIEFLK